MLRILTVLIDPKQDWCLTSLDFVSAWKLLFLNFGIVKVEAIQILLNSYSLDLIVFLLQVSFEDVHVHVTDKFLSRPM